MVGFFRSNTRKGLSLDSDDVALLSERFRDAGQVALVIRPFATRASVGAFFTWQDGRMEGEASPLEFPFNAAELARQVEPGAPAPRTVPLCTGRHGPG